MPKTLKTETQVKADLAADQAREQMVAFYDRRHPGYNDLLPHWEFLEDSYRGGRTWFTKQIFRYHKEGDKEFADRLERAYRFNHTREVVELLQKYLFKAKITRSAEAPVQVSTFWKKVTKTGLDIDQFMRQVSAGNSIGGRVAIVVDNNYASEVTVAGETRAMSQTEAEKGKYKVYAYMVPTKHILDYAWDEDGDGELLWIKLREVVRDDADPIHSTGEFVNRVRLWTRQAWFIYEEVEEKASGGQAARRNIVLKDSNTHGLGFVPVRLADHTVAEDPYRVPALIDDIAYLDRAVANYLSSLDAIIQDQTFSQLAIPAQAVQQGDDMFQKVLDMGTKRIFVYDAGTSSAKPEFLSPDPKQAGVILSVINKVINEIYHTIGLAGERTKEDNAVGIDNSSGVAKAYDFERVNSLLLSKGQSCEGVENWIVSTVLAWHQQAAPADPLVTYPTNFDVMRLADDLVTAEALAKLTAPIEVRRQQMRQTVDKMMPQLDSATGTKITKSIDDWLEGTDVILPPTSFGTPGTKPVAAPKRQGSVTPATK
jgi:hypothetical protein